MSTDLRDGLSFGKTVVGGIQEKNVPFMAASIAYQAFISLLPLLVLVFFLVTFVGGDAFADQVSTATEGFLPDSGQLLIENAIEDSPASAGSTIIGLVVLLWGSLKIFRGLDTAFSEIYGTTNENSFFDQIHDALIVFGVIGGALIFAAVATAIVALLPEIPFLGVAQSILLFVVLAIAFFPMYYYFPDVGSSKRQVIPGVVVAALGWTLLQSLFRVYVSFASSSESAGPLGAILLLLTWLYFGGMILLVGAVINAIGTGYLEPGADEEAADETGDETAALEEDSIAATDRDPFVDDGAREREQLAAQVETLRRERDQLENDLNAQRERRYRLEDRVDDLEASAERLEATVENLETENERLRRELEERRETEPAWRRGARTVLRHVRTLNVGTVERRK
ncbi:ribonuclease BN [Haloterrigena turkmenica DSM 5511]|uniref:Ribonuclease BN n=1 Tax=Haloterrigena turkmenica (strain ATCC 51198 / DSM 5511 / JCM 9101 / NCIMB 13204 / VKM B-1734 / 4k) TaxID=543526 RepID=D2RRF7_HALTV|nr:YihY/virulence factor BrkB family protein [Haloterrigena turkmenica]ADB60517.1 ribonuclease BN [Haloterrigena turkmenica DSM 5511]